MAPVSNKKAVPATIASSGTSAQAPSLTRLPYDLLARIVNRVVYDITSKPPGTTEWE